MHLKREKVIYLHTCLAPCEVQIHNNINHMCTCWYLIDTTVGEWVNRGGLLVRMFRKLVKKRNKSAVAAMERKKRSKNLLLKKISLL